MELASPLSQETEEISSAPSDEEDNSNAQLQSAFHLPLAANILLVQKKRQKAGRRMKKPKCVKQTKTLFHFNFKAEDSAKTIPYSRKSTLRDTTCTSYSPKKGKCSASFNSDWKDLCPLSVSRNWYKQQGHRCSANNSRSNRRMEGEVDKDAEGNFVGISQSTCLGNLHENVAELTQKINNERSEKEKLRLMAIKTVGQHLIDTFPIIITQQASNLYFSEKEDSDEHISKKRRLSNMVYETLSRHLNVIQLYMKGTAYITEQRKGPLGDILQHLTSLSESISAKDINTHVEGKISHVYKSALEYLDSERDRDAVKFLITKITSVSFAAKLQGTTNKRSIQKCLGKVPIYLDQFNELSENLLKEVEQYASLNDRQKGRSLNECATP